MTVRSSGRPVVRSSVTTMLLLVACAALNAAEPLICRGFDAASAASAITSTSGRLLGIDPPLRQQRVWFILADSRPDAARQAMAHALSCWWTERAFTRNRLLADPVVGVRSFPPLPSPLPGAETLLRRLMEPWLAGDGGLVLDDMSGIWTLTASVSGQQHLERLLAAMGDPTPRAPHLLPAPRLPDVALPRAPAGSALGDWVIDLGRLAGIGIALGPDLDPARAAPTARPERLADAVAELSAMGIQAGLQHDVLCLSAAAVVDRRHPAERAAIAILPTTHLTRDAGRLATLAAQLGARVSPQAWEQPGWAITPLPARGALLVVADPEAIHAVMTALEAADQAGLDAWLR